jgi:hypothetical protein
MSKSVYLKGDTSKSIYLSDNNATNASSSLLQYIANIQNSSVQSTTNISVNAVSSQDTGIFNNLEVDTLLARLASVTETFSFGGGIFTMSAPSQGTNQVVTILSAVGESSLQITTDNTNGSGNNLIQIGPSNVYITGPKLSVQSDSVTFFDPILTVGLNSLSTTLGYGLDFPYIPTAGGTTLTGFMGYIRKTNSSTDKNRFVMYNNATITANTITRASSGPVNEIELDVIYTSTIKSPDDISITNKDIALMSLDDISINSLQNTDIISENFFITTNQANNIESLNSTNTFISNGSTYIDSLTGDIDLCGNRNINLYTYTADGLNTNAFIRSIGNVQYKFSKGSIFMRAGNITTPSIGAITPTSGDLYMSASNKIYIDSANILLYSLVNGPNPLKIDNTGKIVAASIDLASSEITGILKVQNGGTNVSSFTTNSIILSGTTTSGSFQSVNIASNQILVGSSTIPTSKSLFSGKNIIITHNTNDVTFDVSSDPSFNSITIYNTTSGSNQAIIDVTSNFVGSFHYYIPNTSTDANFILSESNQTMNGNKTFNGLTTISSSGSFIDSGTATFNGLTTISSSGSFIDSGTATFNGVTTISSSGSFIDSGTATFNGVTTISSSGSFIDSGTATFNGVTTISSSGSFIDSGTATFNGLTTISSSGSFIDSGTATFNGVTTISPSGSFIDNGTATFNGTTTISLSGSFIDNGTATFNGTTTIGSAGSLIDNGTALFNSTTTIGSSGSFIDNGSATFNGTALFNSTSTIGSSGSFIDNGTAVFNSTTTIGSAGSFIDNGTALFKSTTTIGTTGSFIDNGTALFNGIVTFNTLTANRPLKLDNSKNIKSELINLSGIGAYYDITPLTTNKLLASDNFGYLTTIDTPQNYFLVGDNNSQPVAKELREGNRINIVYNSDYITISATAAATTGTFNTIQIKGTTAGYANVDWSSNSITDIAYNIPDVPSGDFVMTTGNQNISGLKTISNIILSGLSGPGNLRVDVSNNIIIGAINLASDVTNILNVANGGTGKASFIPNSIIISDLSGTNLLSSINLSSNQILVGSTTNPIATNLIAGVNTAIDFTSPNITVNTSIDPSFNTVSLGATNKVTVGYIGSARSCNIIDTGVDTSFVMANYTILSQGAIALSGNINKTLTDVSGTSITLTLPPITVSGQLFIISNISTTDTVTLSANGVETINYSVVAKILAVTSMTTVYSSGTNWIASSSTLI